MPATLYTTRYTPKYQIMFSDLPDYDPNETFCTFSPSNMTEVVSSETVFCRIDFVSSDGQEADYEYYDRETREEKRIKVRDCHVFGLCGVPIDPRVFDVFCKMHPKHTYTNGL